MSVEEWVPGLLEQVDLVQTEINNLRGAHGGTVEFSVLQALMQDLTDSALSIQEAVQASASVSAPALTSDVATSTATEPVPTPEEAVPNG